MHSCSHEVVSAENEELVEAFVQVYQGKGNHAVCEEGNRIQVACGGCGPHWGDLAKCKKLCTDTPGCNYLTFFNDDGCRVYRDCHENTMWNQNYGGGKVLTSSFKKEGGREFHCGYVCFQPRDRRGADHCGSGPVFTGPGGRRGRLRIRLCRSWGPAWRGPLRVRLHRSWEPAWRGPLRVYLIPPPTTTPVLARPPQNRASR